MEFSGTLLQTSKTTAKVHKTSRVYFFRSCFCEFPDANDKWSKLILCSKFSRIRKSKSTAKGRLDTKDYANKSKTFSKRSTNQNILKFSGNI